jgi:hypothetical protein
VFTIVHEKAGTGNCESYLCESCLCESCPTRRNLRNWNPLAWMRRRGREAAQEVAKLRASEGVRSSAAGCVLIDICK